MLIGYWIFVVSWKAPTNKMNYYYKYFTLKKHWRIQAYCLWTGWQKELTPCHVSSISLYTSTPAHQTWAVATEPGPWGGPALSHRENFKYSRAHWITPIKFPWHWPSNCGIQSIWSSDWTVPDLIPHCSQAASSIRYMAMLCKSAKHRICEQSCYVFKHYK